MKVVEYFVAAVGGLLLALAVAIVLSACAAYTTPDPVTGRTGADAVVESAYRGVTPSDGIGVDDGIAAAVGAASTALVVLLNGLRKKRNGSK